MKKLIYSLTALFVLGGTVLSCKDDFLERSPYGALSQATLKNAKGVDALLISTYSALDGWTADWNGGAVWFSAGSNWVFGSIVGGDAYKGTDAGDQPTINPIERHDGTPDNEYFRGKWRLVYEGVARANDVIRIAPEVKDIPEARKAAILAEARFLRGHYHFEAKKMWNNIPYIDEKKVTEDDFKIGNTADSWPLITADLKFASDNLPDTQAEVGRVNKWAARAMYAKALLFQNKHSEALPIFNDIIANGRTSDNKKYALNACFHDNFKIATKNSAESVFAAQSSVNDGTEGDNGNYGDVLNYPYNGGPGTCCGFFQPSNALVNSYKVDANGLPFIDTFDDVDLKSDQGVKASDEFIPATDALDPRLDWTVGRRGIPYLDWGKHPGGAWVRDQTYGGPYSPKKNVFYKAEQGTGSTASGWAQGPNANNINLIRFADVLLMAAECEVEAGSLERARALVNQVRERAAKGCMVMDGAKTAANYKVGSYTAAWTDKAVARKAVQFERKLELAMEGHRFFDLVRWGIADVELNKYLANAGKRRAQLQGATFKKGKSEYYPIPLAAILNSSKAGVATMKQNPGY
jgi:starch-binding outer membrane protein, SusD/RagB family